MHSILTCKPASHAALCKALLLLEQVAGAITTISCLLPLLPAPDSALWRHIWNCWIVKLQVDKLGLISVQTETGKEVE